MMHLRLAPSSARLRGAPDRAPVKAGCRGHPLIGAGRTLPAVVVTATRSRSRSSVVVLAIDRGV